MKITMNNDNGYNVDIEITDVDKKKNSEDALYDMLSLLATLMGDIQSKVFNLDNIEKKKEIAFFMLDAVKEMLNSYYDDVEKKMNEYHEGEKMYQYMEHFYEEFLKRNSWSASHIFEILDGKTTDLAVIINNDEIHFSIIDKDTDEELILINKVNVSKIEKYTDEPIHEAVEANAIAIIIYDKMLGNSDEPNPARIKGELWFDEQTKKLVDKL